MGGPKSEGVGKHKKHAKPANDAVDVADAEDTAVQSKSKEKKSKKKVNFTGDDNEGSSDARVKPMAQAASESADNNDLWEEEEADEGLRINKSFAKHFEERSRRKELQKLQSAGLEEEESESEDEDEDETAEALDPQLDAQIMQTIAMIRKRDPRIYESSVAFFEHEQDSNSDEDTEDSKPNSSKKQKYKDLVREQLLQRGAEESDDEDPLTSKSRDLVPEKTQSLAYDEEQRELRKAFLSAGTSNEEDEEFLEVREKTPAEIEEEQRAVQAAISEIQALSRELPSAEQEKDAFLTAYMLQQRWKDELDANNEGVRDEEDEEDLDKAEEFESTYNFRFEEEGGTAIQSYARNVQGSVRRVDDTRKKQREARKEKKEKEKQQKLEELKRLKNLKREEIKKKLEEISSMSGGAVFSEQDLEEEWDPDEFERRMNQTFDESYYAQEDPDWKEGGAEGEGEAGAEYPPAEDWYQDEYFNQGFEDFGEGEGEEGGAEGGKQQLEEALSAKDRLIDELYQLDHEDIIAGLPTRFKYRQVAPENYGLSAEEILFADDKELNQYLSLKSLAPYRETSYRPNPKQRKRLRQTIRQRLRELEQSDDVAKDQKEDSKATEEPAEVSEEPIGNRRKRRRKRHKGSQAEEADVVSQVRPMETVETRVTEDIQPSGNEDAKPAKDVKKRPKGVKAKGHTSKIGGKHKNKSKDSRLASYGL